MLFNKKYKYILTCDLETNGVNPFDEWLTGSFGLLDFETLETIRELEVESKPEVYNEEAYEIHFIREETAMSFQPREKALQQIIDFIPEDKDDFIFICHSNVKIFGNNYHFDMAVLRMDFDRILERYSMDKYFNPFNIESTHTIAARLQKDGLIPRHIKKGLEPLCEFFSIEFGHHEAREDRIAMEKLLRIFNELETDQPCFI